MRKYVILNIHIAIGTGCMIEISGYVSSTGSSGSILYGIVPVVVIKIKSAVQAVRSGTGCADIDGVIYGVIVTAGIFV